MGAFTESVIDRYAVELSEELAATWEEWRGDCMCGKMNVFGFLDRCVECAIDCVHLNENEYGGTSECVRLHLGLPTDNVFRCYWLVTEIAQKTLEYQAEIWRGIARANSQGVAS